MHFNIFKQVSLSATVMAMMFAVPAYGQQTTSTAASASAPTSASKNQLSASAKTALGIDASVTPASLLARYPAGSITAVKQADDALEDVKKGRIGIEARFKADEKACYKTFLANKCVAEAKDRRRLALAEIKPIQIEADRFKRHDAVVKRDKALAEKRAKEEGKPRLDPNVDVHAEKFEDKQQKAQANEKTAAEKRAESEAAFQKKVQDREAAQRRVEEKKAKTELRRKKKAASAAAKQRSEPSSSSASSGS